jgi:hypothetical protein
VLPLIPLQKGSAPFENPASTKENGHVTLTIPSLPPLPVLASTPSIEAIMTSTAPLSPMLTPVEIPVTPNSPHKYEDIICCVCGDGDSYDTNMIGRKNFPRIFLTSQFCATAVMWQFIKCVTESHKSQKENGCVIHVEPMYQIR